MTWKAIPTAVDQQGDVLRVWFGIWKDGKLMQPHVKWSGDPALVQDAITSILTNYKVQFKALRALDSSVPLTMGVWSATILDISSLDSGGRAHFYVRVDRDVLTVQPRVEFVCQPTDLNNTVTIILKQAKDAWVAAKNAVAEVDIDDN